MPPAWQPRAKPPTTPISRAFNSSSLHFMLPLPTPTQEAPQTGSPSATMLSASLVTSAGNCAAAVSKVTCRKRWLGVRGIALRLTITTSAHDDSAASARTTAAPTCPVPPMIKTRNAIVVGPFLPAANSHAKRAREHQRKLFTPHRVVVPRDSLGHHDIRRRIAE